MMTQPPIKRRPYFRAVVGGVSVLAPRWRVYRHRDRQTWCAQPIPEGVLAVPETGKARFYRHNHAEALATALHEAERA
jgi:hypothetical protein